jgi:hypothetical protein
MRFVVAKRLGRRGEGLGNELVAWCKGFIASQELQAKLIGPSWGLNRRKYYRNFGGSRGDVLVEELLCHLPHYEFTEADYCATGEVAFGKAIRKWAQSLGLLRRNQFVVTVDGLYGGYPCIRAARPFLYEKLLASRDAQKNLYKVTGDIDQRKLFIAVHMRSTQLGFDSVNPDEDVRGRFNFVVPGEWYLSVCQAIYDQFGDRAHFHFFTDKGSPAFDEALRRFSPHQEKQTGLTECSDLLAMSAADLRVCSVSSYSLASCFLSDGPYIWYENQLNVEDGFYSIWGHEPQQRHEVSLYRQALRLHRNTKVSDSAPMQYIGLPMGIGDALPQSFVDHLEMILSSRDQRTNLMNYGVIPQSILRSRKSGRCT